MPYFWQNFPKAVEATADSLTLRLFPRQYGDVHELQGGEQKTHDVRRRLRAGRRHRRAAGLVPAARRGRARRRRGTAAAGVVPYLTPRADDPHADYLQLVDAAVEGADTFEHKREVIDEYGWRHFGDIYGDHEAVFHKGPDAAGLALQQPVRRRRRLRATSSCAAATSAGGGTMDELAGHVIDIDIYHTDRDKSAYNHGLFWHTYHYVDADTGTHRSYPHADAAKVLRRRARPTSTTTPPA